LLIPKSRDFGIGKFTGSRDSGIPGSRDYNPYAWSTNRLLLTYLLTYLLNWSWNMLLLVCTARTTKSIRFFTTNWVFLRKYVDIWSKILVAQVRIWLFVIADTTIEWMNEWMKEYDLSDALTETVAGALYRNEVLRLRWVSARKWRSKQVSLYRCRQKEASDDVDRTLGGKEFQARAAATGNARSPRVDRRVDRTTSVRRILFM